MFNMPKLETTQTPFNMWIVKPSVVYSYHETLGNKKEKTTNTHNNFDRS